jgi:hypothetical protein
MNLAREGKLEITEEMFLYHLSSGILQKSGSISVSLFA